MNTVTRAHLAETIYTQVGLSRNESADLLETVLEKMCAALEAGESVKISGFGTFSVRQKGRRVGRNPGRWERNRVRWSDIVHARKHRKLEDSSAGFISAGPQSTAMRFDD